MSNFSQMLTKITVEAALNIELDEHLGYSKHSASDTSNSRNGHSSKTLRTEEGQDEKYPSISRSWRTHWENLNTLFIYPHDIRKAIYTTNAIESLNSVIRQSVKKRKLFPSDNAAKKVIYLAIQKASKKWTMPIRNWKMALNRFMIEFEDRLKEST